MGKRIRFGLFLFTIVLLDALLLEHIETAIQKIQSFSYETAYENLRAYDVPPEVTASLWEQSGEDMDTFCAWMAVYFSQSGEETDADALAEGASNARAYHAEEFDGICGYIRAIWADIACFPVGSIEGLPEATVSYADSWMQGRTFGGERGHEGCDLMASVNKRGIYPIYSVSDGVIEAMGWLRLGGWRIGVRSPSGAYFYYAHLAEYADGLSVGDTVSAGSFLGFMGDSGYSDVPGTTGNFDVHLHFGIYLNDADGTEFSVNSYPMVYAAEHGLPWNDK